MSKTQPSQARSPKAKKARSKRRNKRKRIKHMRASSKRKTRRRESLGKSSRSTNKAPRRQKALRRRSPLLPKITDDVYANLQLMTYVQPLTRPNSTSIPSRLLPPSHSPFLLEHTVTFRRGIEGLERHVQDIMLTLGQLVLGEWVRMWLRRLSLMKKVRYK